MIGFFNCRLILELLGKCIKDHDTSPQTVCVFTVSFNNLLLLLETKTKESVRWFTSLSCLFEGKMKKASTTNAWHLWYLSVFTEDRKDALLFPLNVNSLSNVSSWAVDAVENHYLSLLLVHSTKTLILIWKLVFLGLFTPDLFVDVYLLFHIMMLVLLLKWL